MPIQFHQNIIDFLSSKSWSLTEEENERGLFSAKPPDDIGFGDSFSISFSNRSDKQDYEDFNKKAIRVLSTIYDLNTEDFFSSVKYSSDIFAFRIINESTSQGNISLNEFQELIKHVKRLLYRTASFTLENRPQIEITPQESEIYLNRCRFLQTRVGSFETRILLPSDIELRQNGLFGPAVMAYEVNSKLFELLSFTERSINRRESINEDFLISNRSLINIDITKSFFEIYSSLETSSISFGLTSSTQEQRHVEFNDINSEKISYFKDFMTEIDVQLEEEDIDLDVDGYIMSLKTNNPEFERNTVEILAMETKNLGAISIRIKLNEEQYIEAIDAHKNKKRMKFKGSVRKLKKYKTGYKSVEIETIQYMD